jgi:hypothetical protein
MEMTERDDAMQEHMAYLVFIEHRSFSYLDFLSFEVNGVQYNMSHGIFRNKISKLIGADKVELVCNSGLGFYSLKGIQVQKKLMTPNHMGDNHLSSDCHKCHQPQQQKQQEQASDSGDGSTCYGHTGTASTTTAIAAAIAPGTLHSLYSEIQGLPLDKNSLHDIHLRFEVPDIWTILFAYLNVDNSQRQQQQKQQQPLRFNSVSKDISPPSWEIKCLNIKVTVHRTNTVSVVVGCSYAPIAIDINGIIRLSNALTRVEERLSRLLDDCAKVTNNEYQSMSIPEHSQWIVTLWHFGADASIEYTGKEFSATWEVGENALIRAYSKDMKAGKTRIRLERQEYPRKTFADAIEEKLYLNIGGSNSDFF